MLEEEMGKSTVNASLYRKINIPGTQWGTRWPRPLEKNYRQGAIGKKNI
jgi:hypothetical protein